MIGVLFWMQGKNQSKIWHTKGSNLCPLAPKPCELATMTILYFSLLELSNFFSSCDPDAGRKHRPISARRNYSSILFSISAIFFFLSRSLARRNYSSILFFFPPRASTISKAQILEHDESMIVA